LKTPPNRSYPRITKRVLGYFLNIGSKLSNHWNISRQKIANFQMENPQLKIQVVNNPKRIIPAGVNTAVRASHGEIIIRLDGHSMPYPDYVTNCVSALEQKRGDNVGGVWEIKPSGNTQLAACIALAAAHPLGVGDAYYRLGKQAG